MAALLLLLSSALGCSDWIMDDDYGLSVRTMDLGDGPTFSLKTVPAQTKNVEWLPPTKYGSIVSIGKNVSDFPMPADCAFAGLNEAGLSCDLHALLNSSYPRRSNASNDLSLFHFCNYALSSFGDVAELKSALVKGDVHLWGPSDPLLQRGGVHFMVRDAKGQGLAVEFLEESVKLHDDLNDGDHGYGVFTNEPPFPWQLENVRHHLWKQSLARPATTMPGTWYPDERFLRIYLVKRSMPRPASYQQAVQFALHVLNTITVPMGLQQGTDSGFGEGAADHTHYAHIYDHKQRILYWRHESNLQLERVRLADVLHSEKSLDMFNALPFYHDAAHAFA
jgi:penicillin V acylase-like amidase (Ntn superfamily)